MNNTNLKAYKKPHKKLKKRLMIFSLTAVAAAALTAYGADYLNTKNQKSVVNKFVPAVIKTAVQEKDNADDAWTENENTNEISHNTFTWTYKDDLYKADKIVRILNVDNPDENNADAYIRVCIVPRWMCQLQNGICVDVSSNHMGLQDFGVITEINISENSYIMGDVTFKLADDWSDNWIFNPQDGYFYHRAVVEPGNTSACLLESVSVSEEIYNSMEKAQIKLDIDVLADSIQTKADALSVRWGAPDVLGITVDEQGKLEKAGASNE